MEVIIKKIEKKLRLREANRCYESYYQLEEDIGSYIFLEPISEKVKILTLKIIKNLPKDIKEKILEELRIGTIRDVYIYEKIINEMENEENILYYEEKFGIK